MRYYFFQTCEIDRGEGPVNTLRPLEGQTFEDGTEVNPEYNVRSPKKAGENSGGNRLEYPIGTIFCSNHLHEVETSTGKKYYTVYDNEENAPELEFHPVSANPDFEYVEPQHKSDKMNNMFVQFQAFGNQEDKVEVPPVKKKKAKNSVTGPADINGKAKAFETSITPMYEDQLNVETDLLVQWMKKLLNELSVRNPAKRPKASPEVVVKTQALYRAGETIDTITVRSRFNDICDAQKMDALGLTNISKGPLEWYLDMLLNEHEKGLECTARARSSASVAEIDDAAFLLSRQMDSVFGTMTMPTETTKDNIRKAIDAGWTIDAILRPDILDQKQSLDELARDLAEGVIPVPNAGKGKKSLIEILSTDPNLRCPEAKDGFYVDKRTWLLLLRNLKVKQNTILTGPSGSGKTELVKKLCEVTGTPLTIIQMGGVTDVTEHLVGKMDLDPATKGTKFDWAEFALAIQRPGMVLLDEVNRIPRGGANILFSVLDNTRTLHANGAKSTDVREIKVNPECCFFATANIGSEYTDSHAIDEALRTRLCAQVRLDFMNIKTETAVLAARTKIDPDDAKAIAEVASDIRREYRKGTIQYNMSMRESIYTAELVRDGLDVEDALELSVLPHYEQGITPDDPSSEWGQVKALIASHFNSKAKRNA